MRSIELFIKIIHRAWSKNEIFIRLIFKKTGRVRFQSENFKEYKFLRDKFNCF